MTTDPVFYLLLALAAAAGWLVGRQRGTRKTGERVSRLSSAYFRGLNYLLNEQPDKAIELFLEIAEVDPDTVETQLALGTLFRRRGEVERAIRLHQGLVTRAGLSDEHRVLAVLELGEDYMRAGLLDRAETLFSDLVRIEETSAPRALGHLITIYQAERDWPKAIEHAQRYQAATGESMGELVAHFHCELAEQARAQGHDSRAEAHLESAHAADPRSARVAMIRAGLARGRGDWESAARQFERVLECDRDYLPEVLDPLLECYRRLERPERAQAFLDQALEHDAGIAPVLARSRWLIDNRGLEAAVEFLGDALRRRPSVRGQAVLIDLLREGRLGDPRRALEAVASVTGRLIERAQPYRCRRCGFGAKALHWQCPSCKSWGSTKPASMLAAM